MEICNAHSLLCMIAFFPGTECSDSDVLIGYLLQDGFLLFAQLCEGAPLGKQNDSGHYDLMLLKASFNNVKSEMHGPTCYQCL